MTTPVFIELTYPTGDKIFVNMSTVEAMWTDDEKTTLCWTQHVDGEEPTREVLEKPEDIKEMIHDHLSRELG